VGCPLFLISQFLHHVGVRRKRTFGHAVQTPQIAPLCDADAQIVMLPMERVRQEVREGFRLLDRFAAVHYWALWYRNRRDACGKLDVRLLYRSIRRNASSPYCANRRLVELCATTCYPSQCGRARRYPSHMRHYGKSKSKSPRPTSGGACMGNYIRQSRFGRR
jgi:hypothetical protein